MFSPRQARYQWTFLVLLPLVLGSPHYGKAVEPTNTTHFDYVILGGGTAGLVIAGRLSEDPSITVAVVEAGNFEKNNPNTTNPRVLGLATHTHVDWQYESVPQVYGGNQSLIWSSGKGLGGSSLINGMTYMRPASSQIDLWHSLGLELNWNDLFAFSKKSEHFQIPSTNLTALGAAYQSTAHGFSGPLSTCYSPHLTPGNIHEIFNDTFKALGIPPRQEFNGGNLRGFGVQAVTQDGHKDVREDAARAYYYPVQNRSNLVVMVNTTATRILWSPDDCPDGKVVASAAEIVSSSGAISTIYATREIIISAGAIRSPGILEHSGVGNPTILTNFHITPKVSLPAVGENLQDQTIISVSATTTLEQNFTGLPGFVAHTSLHDLLGPNSTSFYNTTLSKLPQYAETIAAQNNGASNASVQQHLLRTQLDLLYDSNTPTAEIVPAGLLNLIGVFSWPLQPFSRGSVHITSSNATAPPAIDAKFFQLDIDGSLAVAGTKFSRKIMMTPPLSDIVNTSTMSPNLTIVPDNASDEVWLDWIKTKSVYSPNFHPLGTCAMLPRGMGGVVDKNFRVYGTSNVRVVDLSVIPLQVAGHSTALLYGVAELAAEKIKKG